MLRHLTTHRQMLQVFFSIIAQGVVTVTDVSQEQVDGMAGGETLKSQTLAFGVVRNAKQLQKGAARLLAAMQQVPIRQFLTSSAASPTAHFLPGS